LILYPVNAGRLLVNNTNICFSSGVNVGFSNSGGFSSSAFPTLDVYYKRRSAGVMELVGELFAKPYKITTTERDALSGLTGGEIIFNTTTSKHQGYDGTTWNDLY